MIRTTYNNKRARTYNPRKFIPHNSLWRHDLVSGFDRSQTTYITFDGSSGYATWTDKELLAATDDFTIEFWAIFYTTTDWQRVFTQNASKYTPLSIYLKDSYLAFNFGSGHPLCFAGVEYTTSLWQHFAITKNGSTYKGFVDGKQAAQVAESPNAGDSDGNTFAARHAGTRNWANATLWQFRVWGYPMTQQEIIYWRKKQPSAEHPALKAFWPMNEESGSNLYDVTGNGYDAVLSSTGWSWS